MLGSRPDPLAAAAAEVAAGQIAAHLPTPGSPEAAGLGWEVG